MGEKYFQESDPNNIGEKHVRESDQHIWVKTIFRILTNKYGQGGPLNRTGCRGSEVQFEPADPGGRSVSGSIDNATPLFWLMPLNYWKGVDQTLWELETYNVAMFSAHGTLVAQEEFSGGPAASGSMLAQYESVISLM